MNRKMRQLRKWLKEQNHEIDVNGKLEFHNSEELTIKDNTIAPDVNFPEYKFKLIEHDSRHTTCKYHNSLEYMKCLCVATGHEGELKFNIP